jgi:anti-anti-sigma factor
VPENRVDVEDRDEVRVLRVLGELDLLSVPPLLTSLPGWVADSRGLALDLTGTTFFDSSGVRLVDDLGRECARVGVPFRVVAPPGHLARRVLEVVGLVQAVADDLMSAVCELRAAAGLT